MMFLIYFAFLFVSVTGQFTDNGIERPCRVYDTKCIRHFFAANSDCHITNGPIPEPMYREKTVLPVISANITAVALDVLYDGFSNARIEEFFIDRNTDQVILSVEFRNVVGTSNNTYFFYYRRSQEPVVTNDFLRASIQSSVITALIPGVHNIQYDKAHYYAFTNDLDIFLAYGPNSIRADDPIVLASAAESLANRRLVTRDVLFFESTFFMTTFVQSNLCDFGIRGI